MSLDIGFETVGMVQGSWDTVKKIPNVTQVAGELLFRNIFRIAPGAWAMFPFGKGYDTLDDEMFKSELFHSHAKNVVGMLDTAVHFLGPDLQCLEEALITLGANHVGYGVLPEHYPIVGEALLCTLETALADAFTPTLKDAWAGVYGFVTDNMLKGANESLLRLSMEVYGSEETITLDEYVSSMIPDQKELYYATSEEASFELHRLEEAGVTVLMMEQSKADLVVTNLQRYLGRKLVHVGDWGLDLSFLDEPEELRRPSRTVERRSSPSSVTQTDQIFESTGLSLDDAEDFCAWLQGTLGPEKVLACTPTCKFASLPARVILHKGMDIQKKLRQMEDFDCIPLPKTHVEINPSHEFIGEIQKVRAKHPKIAAMMAQQVHDNCLINAGLMDDCRGMVNRITDISMALLKCKNDEVDC